jgi:hypothetical protein
LRQPMPAILRAIVCRYVSRLYNDFF